MNCSGRKRFAALHLLFALSVFAADPTFMGRVPDIQPQPDDLTRNAKAASCKPIFGAGDKDARQLHSAARYGVTGRNLCPRSGQFFSH